MSEYRFFVPLQPDTSAIGRSSIVMYVCSDKTGYRIRGDFTISMQDRTLSSHFFSLEDKHKEIDIVSAVRLITRRSSRDYLFSYFGFKNDYIKALNAKYSEPISDEAKSNIINTLTKKKAFCQDSAVASKNVNIEEVCLSMCNSGEIGSVYYEDTCPHFYIKSI